MTVYARQIARAKAKIAAKGEACVWTHYAADTTAQPGKPWEPTTAKTGNFGCSIVWVPESKSMNPSLWTQQGNPSLDNIPGGYKFGIMGSVTFEPLEGDVITLSNGDKWTVDKIDPLQPDGTPIIYTVRVRQ